MARDQRECADIRRANRSVCLQAFTDAFGSAGNMAAHERFRTIAFLRTDRTQYGMVLFVQRAKLEQPFWITFVKPVRNTA